MYTLYIQGCAQRLEAESKEFEAAKIWLFHLKSYSMFQDLSWRSIETGFCGFKTQLKFI